jgi:hypothetical protein
MIKLPAGRDSENFLSGQIMRFHAAFTRSDEIVETTKKFIEILNKGKFPTHHNRARNNTLVQRNAVHESPSL